MYREYLKVYGYTRTNMKTKEGNNNDSSLIRQAEADDKIKDEVEETVSELPGQFHTDLLSNHVNSAFGNSESQQKQRKLVLHFDIRNTVLVADSVTNVSVEQALNSFLTGVTWGKEGPNGEWIWHSDQLSLTPPAEGVETYYKYLEQRFVKNTNDRTQLRLATGDFTLSEIGRIFHSQFQTHLEMLKWRHDFEEQDHNILTMPGKDGQQYNYIVPAVYKCIHHLIETKRDFAIVFRTFGLDAPNVIKSLHHGLKGNHPGFPKPINIPIDDTIGTVKRSATKPTVFTDSENAGMKTYTGDREIYNMLSQKVGISGFRDDVHYWLENNYHHGTSKPQIIDPYDQNVHHIFFDDNFRPFEEDSIIDVRIFESRDAKDARSLSNMELAQFENVCLVQADLIQCIDDEDYYVKRIEECESKYSAFLKKFAKLYRSVSVKGLPV